MGKYLSKKKQCDWFEQDPLSYDPVWECRVCGWCSHLKPGPSDCCSKEEEDKDFS